MTDVQRNRTLRSEIAYLLNVGGGGRVEFMLSDRPREDEQFCCQFVHGRLPTNAVGFGDTPADAVRHCVNDLHRMVADRKRKRRKK